MSPYRDSLAALLQRREQLVRELEILDLNIRQRAVLVIPCFTGLSRWQERKVRKAWEVIRKLAPWAERCCEMETWDPCPERHAGAVCGFVDEMIKPQGEMRAAERARSSRGAFSPQPPPRTPRPGPPSPEPSGAFPQPPPSRVLK